MSEPKLPEFTLSRRTLSIIIICAVSVILIAIIIPLAFCRGGDSPASSDSASSSAKPEPVYYEATFDYAGLKENLVVKVKKGELLNQPEDPQLKYYDFKGWFANKKYDEWFDFDSPINADVTVYARFDDANIDRATYFERFNADEKNIDKTLQKAKKVLLYGEVVISEVSEREANVINGFVNFEEHKVALFYTEDYLERAFYHNADIEIVSETYSFRRETASSGFTITYVNKNDGNTYSFLTVIDQNHRLSAAQLRLELTEGSVNIYTVFINKYIYEN